MKIFKSKRKLNKANAFTAMALMGIVVLVFNIFSAQIFARFDATANKDYSISPATKDILRNLPDTVIIKAYFTENLPSYLLNANREVRDLLAEIETNSNGKIIINYLDPNKDPKVEQEAKSIGIPTLQFNVIEKDQYQVTNGYLGIAILFKNNKEIIPLVQNISSLEYDIAAGVSKVSRKDMPKIAFLSGAGTYSRTTDLTEVSGFLERQYDISDWSIESGDLIPEDIKTLIVPGVRAPLTKRQQYVIDQFLMHGGSILVMQEGTEINPAILAVNKLNTGLDELLGQWGVKVNKNLILDVSNQMAGFRSDTVQFFTPYPLWVKIIKGGFNPESGIVNKLESLILTWASSVDVLKEKLTDKTQVTDLARTTLQSWAQTDTFQLNPQQIPAPKQEDLKQSTMAVMLSGQFKSLFTKDTIPTSAKATAGKPAFKSPVVSQEEKNSFKDNTEQGRLIVIGDADFITDNNVKQFNFNAIFFQNIVDALSSDEKLISIRSKSSTDRPIKELSDSTKNIIRWLNILGVSALFSGYGLLRFLQRRKTRLEL